MTIELGWDPITLRVTLVPGFDFIAALDSLDGDWPVGALISLVFDDVPLAPETEVTTWTATLDAAAADWDVDKVDVDGLIGRLPARPRVQLTYVDGPADILWASGPVAVERA